MGDLCAHVCVYMCVCVCRTEMREKLACDDEDIDYLMTSLAEDRIMKLTEAEVVEVGLYTHTHIHTHTQTRIHWLRR